MGKLKGKNKRKKEESKIMSDKVRPLNESAIEEEKKMTSDTGASSN